MEGGMASRANEAQVDVLLAPFNKNYMISELDRMLTDEGASPQEMRAKLRTYLMRRIDECFSDSLRTRNMLFAEDQMLDYLYNGTDHVYKEMMAEEEEEEGWLKRRLKKKEEPIVYGTQTSTRGGQIAREAILNERYMSARLANKGMTEYLQDSYHHKFMLYITQLEIRRDTKKGATIYGETDYTLSVHYSLLGAQGQEVNGGRIMRSFDRSMATVPTLTDELFTSIAKELFDTTYLYLNSPVVQTQVDQDDY